MLEQLLQLDVAAEDADNLVLCVGHGAGDGGDQLVRELGLVDVHDVQVAGLHGLGEPFPLGEVVAQGQLAVLLVVGGIGDARALELALGVREVEVLDEGILLGEGREPGAGGFGQGQQILLASQLDDEAGCELAGQLLHAVVLGDVELGHVATDELLHLLVGEVGGATLLVGLHDGVVDAAHRGVPLGDLGGRARELEVVVDPVGDAGAAGLVGDDDGHGATKDAGGVEDVVDLFVLGDAVHVHAGRGGVEVAAHEGVVEGDVVVELGGEVVGQLVDDRGVGGRVVAGE